jgi:phospholipid transport system transporter-binding protein
MAATASRTIAPEGALTMATVRACQESGRAALQEGDLVFDLSAVTETDSAALACIFDLLRVARARRRSLRLTGLSGDLRNLASVYGVAELLPEAD